MKRSFFLVVLALCGIIGGAVLLGNSMTARPMATLQGLTKGTPNWTVDDWFIRMSPQRAQLMQDWFKAGTNAAQFSITNATRHGIRVDPIARFDTPGQHRDTPVLSARTSHGVYVGPGEVKTVQVARLPYDGRWRIGFSYVRDDGEGHALMDLRREAVALLRGAPSPSRVPDEFRDSITFSSGWIEQ
jgi:hypothetical protein